MRDEIEKYIIDSEEFANTDAAPVIVRITSFADDAIGIMVFCFTNTTDWGEWLSVKERLAHKVKDILHKGGADFAVSSETPDAELGSDKPDSFVPPSDDEDEKKEAADAKAEEQKSIQKQMSAAEEAERAAMQKQLSADSEKSHMIQKMPRMSSSNPTDFATR